MAQTNIEWADFTLNPWIGCMKVGPGCDHCYADAYAKRVGRDFAVRTKTKTLKDAVKWNDKPFYECEECGWRGNNPDMYAHAVGELLTPSCRECKSLEIKPARPRVFCASLADVFDNEAPQEWREELWDMIDATPNLDWLLLTKRIGNVRQMIPDRWSVSLPRNVWLGITVVTQKEADRDIPKLLAIKAHVRFLSLEPLLEDIDLRLTRAAPLWAGDGPDAACGSSDRIGLAWGIVGGESGAGARPSVIGHMKSAVRQFQAAGKPVFVKQLGSKPVNREGERCPHIKNRKGNDMAEWPEELRVREFPI